MTDPRHVTRVLVFQCLCLLDAQGDDALPMLRRFLDEHAPDADTAARAEELARRVWRERNALDQKVAAAAERWSVARMQIVDRGILRLGAYEILCDDLVPAAVAINEAVEIAKEFAGADSPGFINGILDSVRKAAEAEPAAREQDSQSGDEDNADCSRHGMPFIKSVAMREDTDLEAVAERYPDAAGLLLDAWQPRTHGGGGVAFDWRYIRGHVQLPLILAGGLSVANVAEAIRQVDPYAVDVSSGVEREKGIKSAQKITAFMKGVSSCGTDTSNRG